MPKRMSDREWIEHWCDQHGNWQEMNISQRHSVTLVAAFLRRVARRHDIITGDRSCDNFCRQWLRSLARELERKGE